MASPAPGGSNPRMPRQPGVPELVVDPIIPGLGNKKPKAPKLKPKLPGAEKAYPMPKIINRNSGGIKSGTPGGMRVNKVYNTY
jgi:hypothetical protein